MPLTGAERQKRYIERLKAENPEKFEERRKKHLEQVKQRQKKIANLSEEEKNIQRKKWREANRKKKEKEDKIIQKENEERLKKGREIRAALYRSKIKMENIELRNKVASLNKKVVALQKALYRTKKKNQQLNDQINKQAADLNNGQGLSISTTTHNHILDANDVQMEKTPATTPLSKTVSFIDSLQTPIPYDDKNRIKKKIFELNVLSDSLKSQYIKNNKNEIKATMKKIVDNEITAKYRMKTNLTKKLGLKGRIRTFKKQYRNVLERDIKAFFLRDDISRPTAGRRETKTWNKIKMQKRFLTDTLDNLYKNISPKEEKHLEQRLGDIDHFLF